MLLPILILSFISVLIVSTVSSTTVSHCLQSSNTLTSSRTTSTTDTSSTQQPLTTIASITATNNDTNDDTEGRTIDKEGDSHTRGTKTSLTDNVSSLIGNNHVAIHTPRTDDPNDEYTDNINTSITDTLAGTSNCTVQSNTTSLSLTPPFVKPHPLH